MNHASATPGASLLSDSQAIYTPGISEHRSGGSHFYLNDALGSPRNIKSANWTMTDDERFEAFGSTVYHGGSSPTTTPYGWESGKANYQSDTSGLMLMGHRFYDPSVGRFLSPDPAKSGGNWYAYCGNDPLGGTDPTGLVGITGRRNLDEFTAKLISDFDYSTSSFWVEDVAKYKQTVDASKKAVDYTIHGSGFTVSAQGLAGFGFLGGVAQGSAGIGIFSQSSVKLLGIVPVGGYTSYSTEAGPGGYGLLTGTSSSSDHFEFGFAGDIGASAFFTNASKASQLSRTTDTLNFTVSDVYGISISLSYGHGIYILNVGPVAGVALDISHYHTNTLGSK